MPVLDLGPAVEDMSALIAAVPDEMLGRATPCPAYRLGDLIDDVKVIPVEGGPHNIGWTHPEVLNPVLLAFAAHGLEAVEEAAHTTTA